MFLAGEKQAVFSVINSLWHVGFYQQSMGIDLIKVRLGRALAGGAHSRRI